MSDDEELRLRVLELEVAMAELREQLERLEKSGVAWEMRIPGGLGQEKVVTLKRTS